MMDLLTLRKHLAFGKGHYLWGQMWTVSFIIWPFHQPPLELFPLHSQKKDEGAEAPGKRSDSTALMHQCGSFPVYSIFKKIICLKGKWDREKERKKGDRALSSINWLNPLMSTTRRPETKRLDLYPGLPCRWQDLKYLDFLQLLF